MANSAQPSSFPSTVPVVVGVDFSDAGDMALRQAFAMVNATPGAEPHAVHVGSAYGPMVRVEKPDDTLVLTMEEASEMLRQHVERVVEEFRRDRATYFERVVTHIRLGTPASEISQLASDLDADLVIVGTHGRRSVKHLLLGSVAEAVMRHARCPVLVVRAKDHASAATSDVPSIEPPCPDCVQARRESQGQLMWCARHSERHGRRHTYQYVGRNVAAQENLPLVRPL